MRAGESEVVVVLILRGPPDRLEEAVLRVRSVQGVRLVLRKDGTADEYFLIKRVKGQNVVGMG
jgi:hypothetical protein